ncbi:MAG: GH25 family lysozyme [Bacillota bacterium]|nr:GH25 family lysozyme [Bacillota bacterium]
MATKKRPKRRNKKRTFKIRRLVFGLFLLSIFVVIFSFLFKRGKLEDQVEKLTFVRGVDVSRYQGEVDFNKLYDQSIRFAFIKATEGKNHQDENFSTNWAKARETKMKISAYHFYTFSVSGDDQADNFISHVDLREGDLGPVIDLEFYGSYINDPLSKDQVDPDLRRLVDRLYQAYGKKVIIYCNKYVYEKYLYEGYEDVDIWYRSISSDFPRLPKNRSWVFWQYDDKGRLDGYGGPGASQYIDLNYFHGDMKDLEDYGRSNS